MEGNIMNSEKIKVEKFFNRLWDKSVSKAVSWFLIGIFLFLIMILCMMPAQGLFVETEDSPWLMPGVLTMLSFMMVYFREIPYNQYTENQKSRFMSEILRYHPINKKEIQKSKNLKLVSFLGKVTGVGLVLQIVVSLIAYQSISWLNFFYIIVFVFGFPVVGVLTFDSIAKKVGEEML